MQKLLLVVLGGGLGSGARYLLAAAVLARVGPGFPWGTMTVNVLGSFLMGGIMQLALSAHVGEDTRLLLTTGLLGGFTTYSTFNYETLRLLEEGAWPLALANVAGTVLACVVAGALGVMAARAV